MNIQGLSMAISQINTKSEVGTALLSKTMETNETIGEGLVKMIDKSAMERSVNPNVGSNVDYYA
ncbi:MAG: YjfB family protein [Lachnospiraceae bacterium]|nr:YjfB family protein [Lachnospiraceae bacterium]